ncbi:MAG TPA: DUF523 domain-containing protein [Desulfomonilia bacterium]
MDDQSAPVSLKSPIIVSACLLGFECRYDLKKSSGIKFRIPEGALLIPVCPEQLGGLSTPRPKSMFEDGDAESVIRGIARIVTEDGNDVTGNFIKGAVAAKRITCITRARSAILKDKSPSCGTHFVMISGEFRKGLGVTAQILNGMGLCIVNEYGRPIEEEE